MIKIYVLLLENQKYYVGQALDVDSRFKMHEKGKLSAEWTRLHKPIKILEIRKTQLDKVEDAIKTENSVTIEYMHKYGWKNVRGGDFCTLNEEKLRLLLTLNSDLGKQVFPIDVAEGIDINKKGQFLFMLKLENQNYFVGRTTNIKVAILNEFNGLGSEWTKLHKPTELVKVLEYQTTDKEKIRKLHNSFVITLMKKFGFQKIRGGDFFKSDERNHKNKVLNYTDIFKK